MKIKNVLLLVTLILCMNAVKVYSQSQTDTTHIVPKKVFKRLSTATTNADGTQFRIDLVQGDMQLQALYNSENNGIGDHIYLDYTLHKVNYLQLVRTRLYLEI